MPEKSLPRSRRDTVPSPGVRTGVTHDAEVALSTVALDVRAPASNEHWSDDPPVTRVPTRVMVVPPAVEASWLGRMLVSVGHAPAGVMTSVHAPAGPEKHWTVLAHHWHSGRSVAS